jgi:glycosyltransferase involved in cell wall biosynthesis
LRTRLFLILQLAPMQEFVRLEKLFSKPLIVLPTYNNAGTLAGMLADVLRFAPDTSVLVVNDGSTDATAEILKRFPSMKIAGWAHNRGKGAALLAGFLFAQQNGFSHVVTMDTDGQHFAADLPRFFEAIVEDPLAVWLGDRGLLSRAVPNAPGSSLFGCRFSNFWIRMETGLRLSDTQTGYRSYPVAALLISKLRSKRFDFEIEILVRNAWSGAPIKSLPISVLYQTGKERVSHFHLWHDNFRLTVLHTRLCILRILQTPGRLFLNRSLVSLALPADRREQNKV